MSVEKSSLLQDILKMEEWTTGMLKQAVDDAEMKQLIAEMARFRETINRKPVLPKTMEIRIAAFMNTMYGSRTHGPAILLPHFVTDLKMTVRPTTTVAEIKNNIFLPLTEYNGIEIQYWGENLSDNVTLQDICNKGQFINILHMHMFYRSSTYKDLYKYFIKSGVSQEKAKNETNTIIKVFTDNGYDVGMSIDESKAEMLEINMMETLQKQNIISDKNASVITNTMMIFFQNDVFNTNVVGTTKEKAKPSTDNITVGSFQNKHPDTSLVKERTIKQDKDEIDSFQDNGIDTSLVKESTIKQDKDEIDIFQDNGIDTSLVKEITIKQDKDEIDTFQNTDHDTKYKKENEDIIVAFPDNGVDWVENTKKLLKKIGLIEVKTQKQLENFDTPQREVVDLKIQEIESLMRSKDKLLEIISVLAHLPPTPLPTQKNRRNNHQQFVSRIPTYNY